MSTFQFTAAKADAEVPLLYSSPHSGRQYPETWKSKLTRNELRRGEDAYVDELIGAAPSLGVAVLAGLLPRCYIDLNRAIDDIDPALLAAPWPEPLRPTEKSRLGLGLIRRFVVPGLEINAGLLGVEDVRNRIDTIYRPYHERVESELGRLTATFGSVAMIDWHSMKSVGNAMTPDGAGARRADVVVSDRDGTSAAPAFTQLAVETLRGFGLSVSVNAPYKGGQITQRYGIPARGRHAIQIEVNRALYLDEIAVEKTSGFAGLQSSITQLTRILGGLVGKGL